MRFAATPLFAQQTPQQLADAEMPSLLTIYKDLHAHPELSGQEEKTAAFVAKELRAVGCEVTEKVGKYEKPQHRPFGVVGVMKNGAGPTVLVRTDLDGLPVKEETGLPYASKDTAKNDEGKDVGVMHACGHDMHMSAFIGTARALAKLKDQWKGTIVFVGQPAEEIGTGARAMLKDGLYTRWPKPDFVLGLHDNAGVEAGKVAVTEGYTFANVDTVDVTVRGVGGHGAYPHKTKDPVTLSAEIITAWQTIASRENNPVDPIVVTVGSIHGGTKHNIISDEVKMQLTVRSYKADVRERVLAAIERIAKGIATAAGLPPDRVAERDSAAGRVYSRHLQQSRANETSRRGLEESARRRQGGADRSDDGRRRFLRIQPAGSFRSRRACSGSAASIRRSWRRARKPGTSLPSLHSSKFAPVPEPTIRTGVIGMTSAVLDLMKK